MALPRRVAQGRAALDKVRRVDVGSSVPLKEKDHVELVLPSHVDQMRVVIVSVRTVDNGQSVMLAIDEAMEKIFDPEDAAVLEQTRNSKIQLLEIRLACTCV